VADSIEAILSQAENPKFKRVATARVLLRQDLAAQVDDLTHRLQQAIKDDTVKNREPLSPALAEELQALEDEVESEKVEFKFGAIGRRPWADLLADHPPRPQDKEADPRADHNPETFPIAAIAASSLEPKMTYEQVERLDKSLNDTQFMQLWVACLNANKGDAAPKSAAAGLILRAKGKSGASATNTESLEASSSDEPSEPELSL
jgi:hypothetical protein